MMLRYALPLALVALAAMPAAAQTTAQTNPFFGSAPAGTATPETLPLSLKEAVARGLQHNLGLLLQEQAVQAAHGARWRALEGLLPDLSGTVGPRRQVINLKAFGFQVEPSIVGPFNVFDARVAISQPVLDLAAVNDVRAASLDEQAERRGVRTARDLVVLVSVNLYLEAIAASSRIDVARAQQQTAEALFEQASNLKASGLVAGIDVLRAQTQIQNQRQRLIVAENDFEKAKLQLARAIGLPPGQAFTLTDRIPYAPLPDVTLESTLARAYDTRADYLAAKDRLAAAEATRKAATAELLPTVHVDADYGAIGESVSDAHSTYTVAATVRVPLFAAGRAQARAAEADALVRQRRAELDDFRGRIDLEVRTALLDVRAAAQQIDAARTSVTLADQELEQARDRFSAGVASNIEVTQAQEAVAAASETYITALYAHNLAKASLARAVGIAEEAVTQFLGGQQ